MEETDAEGLPAPAPPSAPPSTSRRPRAVASDANGKSKPAKPVKPAQPAKAAGRAVAGRTRSATAGRTPSHADAQPPATQDAKWPVSKPAKPPRAAKPAKAAASAPVDPTASGADASDAKPQPPAAAEPTGPAKPAKATARAKADRPRSDTGATAQPTTRAEPPRPTKPVELTKQAAPATATTRATSVSATAPATSAKKTSPAATTPARASRSVPRPRPTEPTFEDVPLWDLPPQEPTPAVKAGAARSAKATQPERRRLAETAAALAKPTDDGTGPPLAAAGTTATDPSGMTDPTTTDKAGQPGADDTAEPATAPAVRGGWVVPASQAELVAAALAAGLDSAARRWARWARQRYPEAGAPALARLAAWELSRSDSSPRPGALADPVMAGPAEDAARLPVGVRRRVQVVLAVAAIVDVTPAPDDLVHLLGEEAFAGPRRRGRVVIGARRLVGRLSPGSTAGRAVTDLAGRALLHFERRPERA